MIWLFVIGMVALMIVLPLIIYTYLIFPNLDGVVQDLEWYNYDEQSQHFLYWFGFWIIVLFGAKGASSSYKTKEKTIIRERTN